MQDLPSDSGTGLGQATLLALRKLVASAIREA